LKKDKAGSDVGTCR